MEYTHSLEDKARLGILENIEDCKFQREAIISIIKEQGVNVKAAMAQVLSIVTSSNYEEMDILMEETVIMACEDVKRVPISGVDMGEANRANMLKNLPSSLR